MNDELTELIEAFSLRGKSPATLTASQLAAELHTCLESILLALDKIPSKFVDIDSSFQEIDWHAQQAFSLALLPLQDPDLADELLELYRELNLYLITRNRFGEAAEWNLKVEFCERLAQTVASSLYKLTNKI